MTPAKSVAATTMPTRRAVRESSVNPVMRHRGDARVSATSPAVDRPATGIRRDCGCHGWQRYRAMRHRAVRGVRNGGSRPPPASLRLHHRYRSVPAVWDRSSVRQAAPFWDRSAQGIAPRQGLRLRVARGCRRDCASPKRGAERVHGGRAQADPCSLRFERRGRKRPVLNDVLVDGFECLA
jgi:hypothetical protein